MKYLRYSSLLLCLLAACSAPKAVQKEAAFLPFWNSQLLDTVEKNSFRITVEVSNANISGILITKRLDGIWKGTLVNEFGLKMFDFTCTPRKCELIHVVPMMNKWYIKKTIAGDVQFMLEIDNPAYKAGKEATRYREDDAFVVDWKGKKEFRCFPNQELVMKNKKRNITYTLKKMDDLNPQ